MMLALSTEASNAWKEVQRASWQQNRYDQTLMALMVEQSADLKPLCYADCCCQVYWMVIQGTQQSSLIES